MGVTHYHRGWRIDYDPPPIPDRRWDWAFSHPDYDGPGDPRFGQAATLEAAKAEIDSYEDTGEF